MAYTLDISLSLGTGKAGLADLRAQFVDTAGGAVGSVISSGFTEIGSGCYLWHCASIPDAHRGGVKFYSAATPATILAFGAINPEEAERVDAAISTLPTDQDVRDAMKLAPSAGAAAAGSVDAHLDTLLSYGLGAGSSTLVYTLTNSVDATPIADATVEVYAESGMSTPVATGITNASGVVTFYLDPGTYYLRRLKSGWNFTNPDTEVVT